VRPTAGTCRPTGLAQNPQVGQGNRPEIPIRASKLAQSSGREPPTL
jgi:hypothetical protein